MVLPRTNTPVSARYLFYVRGGYLRLTDMAGAMAISMLSYPGNTFFDMDCESLGHYEGKIPGTITVSGYSEEYREQQLLELPLLKLRLEATSALPTMELDKIVNRIRLLKLQPTLEDDVGLRDVLGLSQ
jgi:hypothetical protein